MADTIKPRRGPGKPFKPGQSGNLKGRPPIPEEVKKLKALTVTQTQEIFTTFIDMGYPQLEKFVQDKKGTVFQMMVASILYEAVKSGDQSRLSFFLDRLIGKVPDHLNVSGNLNSSIVALVDKLNKDRQIREVGNGKS